MHVETYTLYMYNLFNPSTIQGEGSVTFPTLWMRKLSTEKLTGLSQDWELVDKGTGFQTQKSSSAAHTLKH